MQRAFATIARPVPCRAETITRQLAELEERMRVLGEGTYDAQQTREADREVEELYDQAETLGRMLEYTTPTTAVGIYGVVLAISRLTFDADRDGIEEADAKRRQVRLFNVLLDGLEHAYDLPGEALGRRSAGVRRKLKDQTIP